MFSIIRKLCLEFLTLVEKLSEKGIKRIELSKTIGMKPPQFTNLVHVMEEIARKKTKDSDKFIYEEEQLAKVIEEQFDEYKNISIKQLFELETFIKALQTYKTEFNNFKLQLTRTPVDQLFFNLNPEEIMQIDLIGHTGEEIVKKLLSFLTINDCKHIFVRILIRSTESETGIRQHGIQETIRDISELKIRGFSIQVLFYENLPLHRAVICYYKNHPGRMAFLSSYYFTQNGLSKSSQYAYILSEKDGRHYTIEQVLYWFNHYWGKSSEKALMTHTLILDFDDTILNSHSIQIKAWFNLIMMLRAKSITNEECLFEAFRTDNESELMKQLTLVFFEQQHANRIIHSIFKQEPEGWTWESIDKYRFSERRRLMLDPENLPVFFEGFVEAFREIFPDYFLIIVSATSERLIRNFLYLKQKELENSPNFLDQFLYIFGKNEPFYEWQSLKHKSQLILKISKIMGIPIERMIYVGDNHDDWLASSAIGMDFIEARLLPQKTYQLIGKKSLIRSDSERHFFTSWKDFVKILDQVEVQKQESLKI